MDRLLALLLTDGYWQIKGYGILATTIAGLSTEDVVGVPQYLHRIATKCVTTLTSLSIRLLGFSLLLTGYPLPTNEAHDNSALLRIALQWPRFSRHSKILISHNRLYSDSLSHETEPYCWHWQDGRAKYRMGQNCPCFRLEILACTGYT